MFNTKYVKYGFTYMIVEGVHIPVCFLCSSIKELTNESLRPSKLQYHQKTFHKKDSTKQISFFKEKLKMDNSMKLTSIENISICKIRIKNYFLIK